MSGQGLPRVSGHGGVIWGGADGSDIGCGWALLSNGCDGAMCCLGVHHVEVALSEWRFPEASLEWSLLARRIIEDARRRVPYQKWPNQIFSIVNFVFPHDGHFRLGGGGGLEGLLLRLSAVLLSAPPKSLRHTRIHPIQCIQCRVLA